MIVKVSFICDSDLLHCFIADFVNRHCTYTIVAEMFFETILKLVHNAGLNYTYTTLKKDVGVWNCSAS